MGVERHWGSCERHWGSCWIDIMVQLYRLVNSKDLPISDQVLYMIKYIYDQVLCT